jgi:hypothetical protein
MWRFFRDKLRGDMYYRHILIRFFIFLLLVASGTFEISAQFTNRVRITDAATNSSSGRRTAPRYVPVRVSRVAPVVVRETKVVAVSVLTVTTEPAATVSFVKKGTPSVKRDIVADTKGFAIFNDIKPGIYTVTAIKDGFDSAEAESVTIVPQRAQGLDMDLKPITYRLRIQTNVTGGDVLFAPAIETGKDANGNILSRQLGNYCVVPISRDGLAEITDLKKGYYDIDIRPSALEFEPKGTGINLPEDLDQDESPAAALKTFNINLDKKISTEEFSTVWTGADWNMPSSWGLDRGMKVKGSGIALPRNERYLYYTNFEMIANVKLKDSGVIGFVFRALDVKNYYLLEISGARSEVPNTARLSVVVNGIPKYLNAASTVPFKKALESVDGFRLIVRSDTSGDTGFSVFIEDIDTGEPHGVGDLKDQNNTFRKGAVGIAGAPKADFEVNYFRVCTSKCL